MLDNSWSVVNDFTSDMIFLHGVLLALIPIFTFFGLQWMGYSGIMCTVCKSDFWDEIFWEGFL